MDLFDIVKTKDYVDFRTGGVEFRVNGEKIVKESEAFLLTHPVNSYYITDDYDDNPIIKYGGDWKRIEAGRVLWSTTTDGEGGSLVEAGLPNITGVFACSGMSIGTQGYTATGAFYSAINGYQGSDGYGSNKTGIGFNASLSNSIYGNSNTVQPPAVKVYIWKRVG